MANLTTEQLAFLEKMEIPLSRVYDASGMGPSEYHEIMKSLGMWIAYGVTECGAAGHTMRTRKGHCVQCDPSKISYLRRHDEDGEVYVAHSKRGELTKVGTSQSARERIYQLNVYEYGGCRDWEVVYVKRCQCAGRIEADIHHALAEYSHPSMYFKNGGYIECRELFRCNPNHAVSILNEILQGVTPRKVSDTRLLNSQVQIEKKYLNHEEHEELCKLLPVANTPSKWMTAERWKTLKASRRSEMRLLVSEDFPEFDKAYKWLLSLGSGK